MGESLWKRFIDMVKLAFSTDVLMKVFGKLFKMLMGPIFQELNQFAESVNNAKNNIEKKINQIKQLAKMIKKILKLIVKALLKLIKILVKVVVWLVSTPPGWVVLGIFLVILLIVYLSTIAEALGGFRGTVIVDVEKMKEMNVDSSDYTDLLNTDALLEAFYKDVSDKSFYQMFNVRNMSEDNLDGVSGFLLKQYASVKGLWDVIKDGDEYKSAKNNAMEEIYANHKKIADTDVYPDKYVTGFSGIFNFPQYDPRFIYTDANKNPLKYLKKAEIVGSNPNTKELSAYFRDYYKREKVFMLSEELLYELNKYMYMDATGANSIVYPEAFTQPLHFVNDYMRIDDNKDSKTFGEDYVYVTQRITLDDIRDQTSKFFNKYQLEGIIKSTPSKYVYDYAISKSNVHSVHSSKSAMQVNIGNVTDYVTVDYEIFYDEDNDEDKDTISEVVELYWKIKDDKMDTHMGMNIAENNVCDYFYGPYLEKTVSGDSISFSKNMNICNKDDNKEAEKNKDNWKFGVISVSDDGEITYSTKAYDEDFDALEESTDNKKYVDPKLNLYPRKHVQVAPIEDEDGNLFATSRNLFNKVYIQVKTIKNPYRSSDEYWSRFSEFIDSDLEKGAGLSECTGDAFEEDHKLDWSARKCSLIRHYMSDSVVDWIRSKGAELLAWFKTGDGTNAELEINEKAMYGILLDYEDYLMSVGTYNVEWEYKYFSQTEDDKLASLAEHSTSVLKWLTTPTVDAIKDILGDDSDLYKDTFDSVVDDANKRSVASEYVPVAILTGNPTSENGAYSAKNAWGWGYKYNGDNYKVKAVYGEASMQFPEYYTFEEDVQSTIVGTTWSSISRFTKLYTNFDSSPVGKVLEGAIKFFKDTTYGEVTYGMPNFKYFWRGDSLQEMKWYGYEDGSDNVWLNYKTVKDEKGDYIDFRNDDFAWNPNVEVWRPSKIDDTYANMESCKSGGSTLQCGRVVTKAAPDDYLPMEVKGVRDYGLGSILSYIESRKVVFNTGVAMADQYNIEGVNEFTKKVNEKLGTDVFETALIDGNLSNAVKGYIPKEFLDLSIDGFEVDVNGEMQSNFINIYKKMPQTLETLQQMAMLFNNAQGTGVKSVEFNGCTYSLGGLTGDGTRYKIKGSGSNCLEDGLSAFVPHVKENFLQSAWNWLWNGDKAQDENQFWDPMYYYLSWFDYFEEEKSDNIWSKAIKFISGENFYSHMDTQISQELRAIKNKDAGTAYNLEGVSKVSHWLTNVFKGAGTNVSQKDMDEFFKKYGDKVNGLDLIDRLQSEEVYLIEEAATLIGEFMYTYEDVMTVIGNLTEEDVIVDDLAFIDRYYYLSNYIFALQYVEHKLDTTSFSDDPPCEDCDWESAKTKCKNYIQDLKDTYATVVWYKPWTWFNKGDGTRIYDFGSAECLTGSTSSGDGRAKVFIKYKEVKDNNSVIIDTPSEIIDLIEDLDDSLANKIMINTKVYGNLAEWAGLFADNSSDIRAGINYAEDKAIGTSNDFKKTPGTSSLSQFAKASDIYDNIKSRVGLIVDRETQIDPDYILLTDNGNIDDTKYEVGLKKGINEDLVVKFEKDEYKLTDDNLKKIRTAIMNKMSYGKLTDSITNHKNEKITVGSGTGKKEYKKTWKTGKEWTDYDEMFVSISYADRAKEGYPIPLYLHVAGDTKQIMPEEINKFFDGEVMQAWQKRVELRDDDSMFRDEYIRNYHKSKETYLYDYLENFEAYIPLDVKSDEDMQVRGKDSFLSIGSNETTPIEKLSQSTNAIMQSVLGDKWTGLYNRLGIEEESMAQLVAGLMEYTIEKAPERMIMEYNQYRSNNGLSPIKESAKNKNNIKNAIEGTMYITTSGGTDYNALRQVELELEDESKEKFLLSYVGIGGIKNVNVSGNGGKGTLASTVLNTKDFGGGPVEDDKTLNVNSSDDDRMLEQASIDYVSVKFRKLLQKHGSTAGAIMAYFYSEDYWNQLKVVAEEDGISTGPEWYVAEEDMIEKAVCLAKPETCDQDINTDYYTSKVVDDVLSYVANTEDRLNLIRFASAGSSFGGSAATTGLTGTFPPDYAPDTPYLKDLMEEEVRLGLLSTSSDGYSIPGKTKTYMGWQMLGNSTYIPPSGADQYVFANAAYLGVTDKAAVGSHRINKLNWGKSGDMRLFDDQGFGIVNERYTIAIKPGYGGYFLKDESGNPRNFQIGDYIDVYLEDGTIIPCIMADAKAGENPSHLLHHDGSVIEFVVNKWDWYNRSTAPVREHPEWNQNIVGIAFAGSYWGDENITVGFNGGGGNIWANTIGFNAYTRDELSLQNSGIELWQPYTTFKREDVDMVMLSQASRDGKFVNELNTYDLLTLFTTRQDEEGENALGGSWEYGSSSIQALGTGTDRAIAVHELSGMPPLFRTNRPFAEGVPMRLTSPFGYRIHPTKGGTRMHQGIDLGTGATNPDIFAIAPGKVILNQFNAGGYGWYVIIEHDINCISSSFREGGDYIVSNGSKKYKILGVQSLYAHMVKQSERPVGYEITPENINQRIGIVGSTGASTGNHLHHEIKVKAQEITPSGMLGKTTDYLRVDPQVWLTTSWYASDDAGDDDEDFEDEDDEEIEEDEDDSGETGGEGSGEGSGDAGGSGEAGGSMGDYAGGTAVGGVYLGHELIRAY